MEHRKIVPRLKKIYNDLFPSYSISARQLAYIGLRDVDDGERAILKTLGVAAFSIHDVDAYGIATVVQAALKAIDP